MGKGTQIGGFRNRRIRNTRYESFRCPSGIMSKNYVRVQMRSAPKVKGPSAEEQLSISQERTGSDLNLSGTMAPRRLFLSPMVSQTLLQEC